MTPNGPLEKEWEDPRLSFLDSLPNDFPRHWRIKGQSAGWFALQSFFRNCLLQIINALKCITGVTVKSKAIGFQVHCVMLGKPGGEVTGLDGFFRSPLRNLVQPLNL